MISPDWISAGSNVLGAALGGKPSSAVSSADSIFGTNSSFDNSGFNVSFGSSKITSTSDKTTSQDAAAGMGAAGKTAASYMPYVLIFVGALVAWKMLKK